MTGNLVRLHFYIVPPLLLVTQTISCIMAQE